MINENSLIALFEQERREADDYRRPYEDLWLDGYRAFYNVYGDNVSFRPGGSELYYGLTRAKCLSAFQREADILFNRPGVPWTLDKTPNADVPMEAIVNFILEQLPQETRELIGYTGPSRLMEILPIEIFHEAKEAVAEQAIIEMRRDVEDAWVEDKATIKFKQALLEKVITGTCIIKVGTCQRRVSSWQAGAMGFQYSPESTFAPTIKSLSIFDVWFDPHAQLMVDNGTIEGCDYVVERHVMTKMQLNDLKDKPMFDADAVRACLEDGENYKESQTDRDLRGLRGSNGVTLGKRFEVYERTGYLSVSDLEDADLDVSEFEQPVLDDEGNDTGEVEVDKDEQVNMVVWYCGRHILKAVRNPDKATKLPYFACPQELAPGELYGIGIPYKMRHSQALVNSGIRLFSDNKANASGPIIVVNEDRWDDSVPIESVLRPWGVIPLELAPGERVSDIFQFLQIPDISNQLIPLIEMAKNMAEEESGVPAFSHGAQSKALSKATGGTASGMSMIMGAADLMHKSAVRAIDDYLLGPVLTYFYGWFMQFGDNEKAKGDMNVVALGTVGLMKKEIQSQRLVQLLTQAKIAPPVDPEVGYRLWMDTLESMDLDTSRFKSYDDLSKGKPPAGGGMPPEMAAMMGAK